MKDDATQRRVKIRGGMTDQEVVKESFDADVDGRLIGFSMENRDGVHLGRPDTRSKVKISIVVGFQCVIGNGRQISIEKASVVNEASHE